MENTNFDLSKNELEELYKAARNNTAFNNYSDRELKQKLIELKYADKEQQSHKEPLNYPSKQPQVWINSDYLKKNIRQLNNTKDFINEGISKRSLILINKIKQLNEIDKSIPPLLEPENIPTFFNHLISALEPLNKKDLWNYLCRKEKDLDQFRKTLSKQVYDHKTSVIKKIFNALFRKKEAAISEQDIFLHIPAIPKEDDNHLYGSNYFYAKASNLVWDLNIFGKAQLSFDANEGISLDKADCLSLYTLCEYQNKLFDDIFLLSDDLENKIQSMYANPAQEDDDKTEESTKHDLFFNDALSKDNVKKGNNGNGNARINHRKIEENNNSPKNDWTAIENFFQSLSEAYIPVAYIIRNIKETLDAFPLNEEHPVKAHHLLYVLSWIYFKWILYAEDAFTNEHKLVENDGNTISISINSFFIDLKQKIDRLEEQIQGNTNIEEEQKEQALSILHNLYQYMKEYQQLLPYLRKRIKGVLSSIIADMASDYLLKQDLFLQYKIKPSGKLYFVRLRKIMDKMAKPHPSLHQINDKEEHTQEEYSDILSDEPNEEEIPEAYKNLEMPKTYKPYSKDNPNVKPPPTPEPKSHEIDIMPLVDLYRLIKLLNKAVNKNFHTEYQLERKQGQSKEKYQYLFERDYKKREAAYSNVPHNILMQLQDSYDTLCQIQDYLQKMLSPYIKENRYHISKQEANLIRNNMGDITMLIKNLTDALTVTSQVPEEFTAYSVLIKNFFDRFQAFLKLIL